MIDLHYHVLPGIDDGPRTMADSVALAAAAAAGATRTIVATPHISSQWPDNRAATISAAVDELNAHPRRAGVPVEVVAGAEVALSRAAELDACELEALRLGGGPWLLVECPLKTPAPGTELGLGRWPTRVTGSCSPIPSAARCFSATRAAWQRSSTAGC